MKTKDNVSVAINKSAPVVRSKSILINAEPSKVWSLLTDINNWSSWQPDIRRSRMDGKPVPGTKFDWKSGSSRIRSRIHTHEPDLSFGWTGEASGIHAVHNWNLEGEKGMTKVTVEESMEGPLARLLRKSLSKNLDKGLKTWLESLKKQSEVTRRIMAMLLVIFSVVTGAFAQGSRENIPQSMDAKPPKSIALGIQLGQYQEDFSMGFQLTSPYLLFGKAALRAKYNFAWHEHTDQHLNPVWSRYPILTRPISSKLAGAVIPTEPLN